MRKFQSLLFVLKQSYNLHNSTFKFTKWRNLIYIHFITNQKKTSMAKRLNTS